MRRHVLTSVKVLAVVAALLLAGTATAQEQFGSISGHVTDDNGAPLPGVTVEVSGTAGTLVSVTDDNGVFRFPRLAPGEYTIKATLSGFVPAEAPRVIVALGRTYALDIELQTGFSEEITVLAEKAIVDVTQSQVATSIGREQIDMLPRGRDFTAVVTQAAGVVNDTQAGGISIDGASGLENRYVIDGIDTTDPQIGDSAVPMRAEFFEEVQVKTAGYAAEFGGSTGGVINAITRSGENDFHGGLIFEMQDSSWDGDRRPVLQYNLATDLPEYGDYRKDDLVRYDPGFYLSGPAIRDTLWFFGSYQPGLQDIDRTVDFRRVNQDTGQIETYHVDTFSQELQIDYAAFNLRANLGSRLLAKVGGNISPYEREQVLPNSNGQGRTSQSDYTRGEEGERETYSANVDYIASENLILSVRGGLYHTDLMNTGVNFYPLIHNFSTGGLNPNVYPEVPSNLLQNPGWTSNVLVTDATEKNLYEREAIQFDGSYYVDAAGGHAFKAGYQAETITNDVAEGYNADRILYYWGRSYSTTYGDSVSGDYGYFRLLNISTLGEVESKNEALFIQDSWTALPNLTINVGVRAEHERVPNYGAVGPEYAIEFDYDEKIAPRLGFAWDVLGDQRWKAYGSYGTYYDVTKYEMPRGSFGGDKWVDYFFTFDNYDYFLNDADTCRTGNNTIFDNPVCPAGTLIEAVDRRFNSADPNDSYIDPDLKPMELWEAQVGLDHLLTDRIRLGARLVHKELVRAIEDVGILVPGIGEVYYIANPGEGLTTSIAERPFPKAEREYDALELTFDRPLSEKWSLFATYTYSKLWGNYSGLANSDEQNNFNDGARLSPNVSRLFDTVTAMYDANGDLVYGRLATDRPHQFKAQFMYQLPYTFTVAVNQYIGSGTPVSEIATVPVHTFFYPNGRGNLGRTPTLTQTDLTLTKAFAFRNLDFQLGLTVLNLFDEDTETRIWSHRIIQDLPVSEEEFFAGNWSYEDLVSQVDQDNAYKMADTFQAPREIRLNLRLDF